MCTFDITIQSYLLKQGLSAFLLFIHSFPEVQKNCFIVTLQVYILLLSAF